MEIPGGSEGRTAVVLGAVVAGAAVVHVPKLGCFKHHYVNVPHNDYESK